MKLSLKHTLKHTFIVLGSVVCLAAPTASAQPSATLPPPPNDPGFGPNALAPPPPGVIGMRPSIVERRGLLLGFSIGTGAMSSSDGPIECFDCSDSVAGSLDLHIGWMVGPRLGIMYEAWAAGQKLDSADSVTLVQVLSVAAAQFWLTPRLWIKGGIGTAHLIERYNPEREGKKLDTGLAVMGAVGFELLQGRTFAMDLQLRAGTGTYDGLGDRIHQGTLQLGLSWY